MKPTQEQVLQWAQQVWGDNSGKPWHESALVHLKAFAALAYEAGRKDENEACAKVCEEYQDAVDRHKWPNGYECAAAIRARREQ